MVYNHAFYFRSCAGVAKLADAPDLGSGAARRGGSSPLFRTTFKNSMIQSPFISQIKANH